MIVPRPEFELSGSYQVHGAPALLAFDERADQILVVWDISDPQQVTQIKRHFEPRFSLENLEKFEQFGNQIRIPAKINQEHPGGLYGLVWIVDRLVGPGGCPWDIEQTHESLKKYLLEESYELIEAIDNNNEEDMKEELGDVLLQPFMHSQKKALEGKFGADDVAATINNKLWRRHPHVFGDATAADSAEVLQNWDKIKKAEKGSKPEKQSILSGVPATMPALSRAMEISKRAARSGFEWQNLDGVWEKFGEEAEEVKKAVESGDQKAIAGEIGDLLFTVVNVARWLKVDPEDALRTMVTRFQNRFMWMEAHSERPLAELNPQSWDDLWNQAKAATAHNETQA